MVSNVGQTTVSRVLTLVKQRFCFDTNKLLIYLPVSCRLRWLPRQLQADRRGRMDVALFVPIFSEKKGAEKIDL